MTQIAATTVGGVFVPSTTPPVNLAESWFDGTNYNYNAIPDFFTSPAASPRSTITEVFSGSISVDEAFFGVHYNRHANVVGEPLTGGIVRIHDATWGEQRGHWRGTNTSQGVYDWTALDNIVSHWHARGREMIYTFGVTPAWASARPSESGAYGLGTAAEPSSNTYWTDFCQAIAERYDGRIKYWEVWNEVNIASFYSGTQAKLAELARLAHQTIKGVNASNVILSPNCTSLATGGATYFDGFLAASDGAAGVGADWFDVVACHLYCSASTRMGLDTKSLVDAIQTVLTARSVTAPIWNTETGLLSPDANALPEDKMKHVKRSMVIAAGLGVEHWSLYTYDHTTMGINDKGRYAQEWEDWRSVMLSGAITRVNRLWDGRTACVIGGANYVI